MRLAVFNVQIGVMKIQKIGLVGLLFVNFLVSSHAYAKTTQHNSKKVCFGKQQAKEIQKVQGQAIDGKYYILPGTVCVLVDGIYLRLESKMIPVSFVGVDSRGVYVNESEVLMAKRWECDVCHKYNPDSRDKCVNRCEDF